MATIDVPDVKAGLEQIAGGGRVVVVGDVMLDRYCAGDVSRMSPEAPVPVVDLKSVANQLGGAANVAGNVMAMGSQVDVVGIVGADDAGEELKSLLSSGGAGVSGLLVSADRPTTLKTRVLARGQQIVRLDREETGALAEADRGRVLAAALEALDGAACLLFQDYDKGLLSEEVIRPVIAEARTRGIPVAVDPKFRNFRHYVGVDLVKPNQAEAEKVLGIEVHDAPDLLDAFAGIRSVLDCGAVLITRGSRGMALHEVSEGEIFSVATSAREIFDVSGAGDTVIATLALGIATGVSMPISTVVASIAAGIEVEKMGVATVTPDEIRSWLGANGDRKWDA